MLINVSVAIVLILSCRVAGIWFGCLQAISFIAVLTNVSVNIVTCGIIQMCTECNKHSTLITFLCSVATVCELNSLCETVSVELCSNETTLLVYLW